VYVDAAADDDTLQRCQALALVVPATAVVTDETAAWLHGVDARAPGTHVIPPPLRVFQQPGRSRIRKTGCLGGERTLLSDDIEVVRGIRTTTALRTALDLGRLTPRDRAIGALDGLLRLGRFTSDELVRDVDRFRRFRGVVQLRELAPLADGRAESPPESVLRLRWLDAADLPTPSVQTSVPNAWGFEKYWLDLAVPELRFGCEYDGQDWHSSPQARAHDRQRREWLRDAGWTVVVLTKTDLFGPDRFRAAAIIRDGLATLSAPRARRHHLDTRSA
jgi:8-oxo-dGTP pyrophosphatase MutT (NUDIX family)